MNDNWAVALFQARLKDKKRQKGQEGESEKLGIWDKKDKRDRDKGTQWTKETKGKKGLRQKGQEESYKRDMEFFNSTSLIMHCYQL